jgi:GntR family transcriptional regulator
MASVHQEATSGNGSTLFGWRQVIREADLTPKAKLVALDLSLFMNQDGEAWPSVPRIARETNLSESSVRRALQELEDAGVLRRIERGDGRQPSRYLALIPGGRGVTVTTQGSHRDHPGVSGRPARGVTVTPELDSELGMHAGEDQTKPGTEGNAVAPSSPPPAAPTASRRTHARPVPPAFADHPDPQTRAVMAANDDHAAEAGFDEEVRDEAAKRLRERKDSGAIDKVSGKMFLDECATVQESRAAQAWEDDEHRSTWVPLLTQEFGDLGVALAENPAGPPPRLLRRSLRGKTKTMEIVRIDPASIQEAATALLRRDPALRRRYTDQLFRELGGICLKCNEEEIEGIGVCGECSDYRETADQVIETFRRDVQRSIDDGRLPGSIDRVIEDIAPEWSESELEKVG